MTKRERLVVLGGGESGAGAAVLGKVKGYDTVGKILAQNVSRRCDAFARRSAYSGRMCDGKRQKSFKKR